MIAWLQENWVALGGILLLVLRLVESILVVLKAEKALSVLQVIKEFFKIG